MTPKHGAAIGSVTFKNCRNVGDQARVNHGQERLPRRMTAHERVDALLGLWNLREHERIRSSMDMAHDVDAIREELARARKRDAQLGIASVFLSLAFIVSVVL